MLQGVPVTIATELSAVTGGRVWLTSPATARGIPARGSTPDSTPSRRLAILLGATLLAGTFGWLGRTTGTGDVGDALAGLCSE